MKLLTKINFALIILLIAFTSYIIISDLAGKAVCFGEGSDCVGVQGSEYGKVFGVKVAYIGLFGLLVVLLFYSLANSNHSEKETFRKYYLIAVSLGSLGAIYFLSIQFFVLKQICSSCLVVDFGMLLLAVLSFVENKQNRR